MQTVTCIEMPWKTMKAYLVFKKIYIFITNYIYHNVGTSVELLLW